MAHLQNHSTHWQHPSGFTRGRVDWPIDAGRWLPDPFAPEILASIRALVAETLSAEEASLVISALERIRAAEQALGRGPDAFGLIHADMHYRNLLFEGTTVRAIDFDDCGYGPFLYDPAVMLSAIVDWPHYPALRAALLAGYHRVRPLSVEHEAYLDTFIALRQIQDALWVLQSREHPVLGEDWAGVARNSLTPVPALLEGSWTP
jgi:Ser/Thr protein kinase RdoA (MazF antagonist)